MEFVVAIWVEIICRQCSLQGAGQMMCRGVSRRLRKKVRKSGWRMKQHPLTHRYIDICPDCMKRWKEIKAEIIEKEQVW